MNKTLANLSAPLLRHVTAGRKLITVGLLGIGLFGISSPLLLCLVAIAVVVGYPVAGVPLRSALKLARDLAFILSITCAAQAWLQGPEAALITFARILALVWAAGLMTATTSFSEMMEALSRGLAPLRHLGVEPQRLAFAMTLAIRFIPLLQRILHETREAQAARGVGRNPMTLIVPVMIRVIRLADGVAEAIEARGVFSDDSEEPMDFYGD